MIGTARIFRKNTSTRKSSDYSLSNIRSTLGLVFQWAVASGVKNKVGQKGPL